jgi:hypothetical protein
LKQARFYCEACRLTLRIVDQHAVVHDDGGRPIHVGECRPELGCHVRPDTFFGQHHFVPVAVPEDVEDHVTDSQGRSVAVSIGPKRPPAG